MVSWNYTRSIKLVRSVMDEQTTTVCENIDKHIVPAELKNAR
jgi:hypothetical protein